MPRWLQIALCLVSCGSGPALAEARAGDIAAAIEGSEAWAGLVMMDALTRTVPCPDKS